MQSYPHNGPQYTILNLSMEKRWYSYEIYNYWRENLMIRTETSYVCLIFIIIHPYPYVNGSLTK